MIRQSLRPALRRWLAAVLLLAGAQLKAPPAAAAAELVMFDARWCGICKRFLKEVGTEGYRSSEAARSFPLRVVDFDRDRQSFRLKEPVTGAPTFVLIEDNREIARFAGYSSRSQFFRAVAELAAEYEASRPAVPRPQLVR